MSKIEKWPTPNDLKTLEAFFGFVAYYQSFMLKFAETAYPLTELKKIVRNKSGKFVWTEQCQTAFDKLKQTMLRDPVRAFPIYDITLSKDISPFIITTDFSALGLSAILSQIQGGHERLITCASRKTSPSEQNYSSLKGEMRSLIFALEKFDRFINLQSFFI